eukprot:7811267-Ditylum_brightwellii.AAC.1
MPTAEEKLAALIIVSCDSEVVAETDVDASGTDLAGFMGPCAETASSTIAQHGGKRSGLCNGVHNKGIVVYGGIIGSGSTTVDGERISALINGGHGRMRQGHHKCDRYTRDGSCNGGTGIA